MLLSAAGCSATPAEPDTFAVAEVQVGREPGESLAAPVPLIAPHAAVELSRAATVTELSGEDADALGLGDSTLRPPDGEAFIVAGLTPRTAPFAADGAIIEIVVGEARHDVTTAVADAQAYETVALLATAAADEPVHLVITDAGISVSLDLRTYERVDDAGAAATSAYYEPGYVTSLSGSLTSEGVLVAAAPGWTEEPSVEVSLEGATISRQPWLPGQGWAPEGSMHLLLSSVSVVNRIAPICWATWDAATALTFTPAGGVPAATTAPLSRELVVPQTAYAFVVPADTSAGTLTLAPQLTVDGACTIAQPMLPAELPITIGV